MIITCPDCATRYDVDDERISPNGRSVRCSSCSESWFVPAPELIDVAPMEDKAPHRQRSGDGEDRDGTNFSAKPRMKVGLADDENERDGGRQDRKGGRKDHRPAKFDDRSSNSRYRDDRDEGRNRRPAGKSGRDERDFDEDDDDSLFDSPPVSKNRGRDKNDSAMGHGSKRSASSDLQDDEAADKGWRKGRQFIVEDDDDEAERRPFFARKRKDKADSHSDKDERESLRFADDEDDQFDERYDHSGDDDDRYANAQVVDADWEDVDDGGENNRGFGRKIRAERRRATALAKMEDVRPLDPEALDDEFFAALKVTPRELERAIRKARRRAEAREKNRLTPLRVFGWTAWAAVVAGAAYGIFVYRDEIVKMAPKAADAYAVIGIEANPYGLSIENVRHRLAMSTGGPTIEITGNLRNETDGSVAAPLLQAEALGSRGELLARWTFTANQTDVAQGEMADFITRAPAPDGVTEVALSFAPSGSVLDSLLPPGR